MSTPNPGSDEAVAQGCRCPRMETLRPTPYRAGSVDADRSRWGGWWIAGDCPLHGTSTREEDR